MEFFWVFLAICFYSVGEYYSKKWNDFGGWWFLLLTFIGYNINVCFWLPALKVKGTLALTGLIWMLGAIVASVLLGVCIFDEKFTTSQWIGTVLLVVSCVLLVR